MNPFSGESRARPGRAGLLGLAASLACLLTGCPKPSEGGETPSGREVRTSGKGFTVPIPETFQVYQGVQGEGRDPQLDSVVREGGVLLMQKSSPPGGPRGVIAVKGRPLRPSMLLDTPAGCVREANKQLRGMKGARLDEAKPVPRTDGHACEFRITEKVGERQVLHLGSLVHPRYAPLVFSVVCQVAAGDETGRQGCEQVRRDFKFDPSAEATGLGERDRAEVILGRVKTAREQLKTLHEAVLKYRKEHNRACPADLEALLAAGFIKELPRDPWDQPYHFRCPRPDAEHEWDLSSNGPDQTDGTIDDILIDEK